MQERERQEDVIYMRHICVTGPRVSEQKKRKDVLIIAGFAEEKST